MLPSLRRLLAGPSLQTCLARGDLRGALTCVERALERQPEEPVLLDQRARLMVRLNPSEQARALLLERADCWADRGFGERAMQLLELAEGVPGAGEHIHGRRARYAPLVYLDAVGALEIFDLISRDELIGLVGAMELRRYDAGEALVTQGQPGEEMFVLAEGDIEVRREAPGGDFTVLNRCSAPDFFGEIAMVARVPRTATVVADTALSALVINQQSLATLARSWPGIQGVLEQFVARRHANMGGSTP